MCSAIAYLLISCQALWHILVLLHDLNRLAMTAQHPACALHHQSAGVPGQVSLLRGPSKLSPRAVPPMQATCSLALTHCTITACMIMIHERSAMTSSKEPYNEGVKGSFAVVCWMAESTKRLC